MREEIEFRLYQVFTVVFTGLALGTGIAAVTRLIEGN